MEGGGIKYSIANDDMGIDLKKEEYGGFFPLFRICLQGGGAKSHPIFTVKSPSSVMTDLNSL